MVKKEIKDFSNEILEIEKNVKSEIEANSSQIESGVAAIQNLKDLKDKATIEAIYKEINVIDTFKKNVYSLYKNIDLLRKSIAPLEIALKEKFLDFFANDIIDKKVYKVSVIGGKKDIDKSALLKNFKDGNYSSEEIEVFFKVTTNTYLNISKKLGEQDMAKLPIVTTPTKKSVTFEIKKLLGL